ARASGRTRRPPAAAAHHPLTVCGSSPMRAEVARFDAAVDRVVDRVRRPDVDAAVYRLSSAADHSLLWHFCGAATALARRVYVRLHHASDVAAGAAVGLALGLALRRFVR